MSVLRQKWRLPHTRDVLTPQVTPGATPCPHPDALEFLTPSVISPPEPALVLAGRKVLALDAIGKEICASFFLLSAKEASMKRAFIHLYLSAKSVESATVGRRRKHKQPKKKKKNLVFQREQVCCLIQHVSERLSCSELQGPMASVSFL